MDVDAPDAVNSTTYPLSGGIRKSST